jgi:hypothetical protein
LPLTIGILLPLTLEPKILRADRRGLDRSRASHAARGNKPRAQIIRPSVRPLPKPRFFVPGQGAQQDLQWEQGQLLRFDESCARKKLSRTACAGGLMTVARSHPRPIDLCSGLQNWFKSHEEKKKSGTTLFPTIKSNFLAVKDKENCF